MKKLTKLGKVAEQVRDYAKDCRDEVIPVRSLSFNSIDSIKIGSETHPMKTMAQKSMAYRCNVPHNYISRCPEELQKENLEYWLQSVTNESLLFRFKGDSVRSIFTEKYVPYNNTQIIELLEKYGLKNDAPVEFMFDDNLMAINIPDQEKQFQIKKDKYIPGTSIVNSETGISSIKITSYTYRIVCQNGLIHKTQESYSRKHLSEKINEEFPEVMNRVLDNLNVHKKQFKIALDTPVDNPIETIKTFNRQFQLSENERAAVSWGYETEPGNTMFSVINAYTSAPKFQGLTAAAQYNLQKTGGQILALLN
ncbi:DUF932 domain-containing protein [candidate division KSB1 bacterium]